MKRKSLFSIAAAVLLFTVNTTDISAKTKAAENIFVIEEPDYKTNPYTGMSRKHWMDAAKYLLNGAFSYIKTIDDPMKFPKHLEKAYPHTEGQLATEKLEGLCRTLFIAAPILKEEPDLVLNGIKVADYYRHQILNLINPNHPSYIKHRGNGGPSQILVEFGALAISLSVTDNVLWNSFTKEQQDAIAAMMISYGDGPTINSNWRFFNIFVLSFFKEKGYPINEARMIENLDKVLDFYRGNGWYNDAPAYDYYSMWAFQMYGPVWAHLYGYKQYPEYADYFITNLSEMTTNYPYMFNRDGHMNMWGRSISYRFGAIAPLPLLTYTDNPNVNLGWLRYISSSTLLQFLQNPDFMEDNVPTLGFYGKFAPAVQIYSCRGSVYWAGKAFFILSVMPEDDPFWHSKENIDPWNKELKKGNVYNKFQPGSNLLITNYPNSGSSEMRSWCHESVASDWQKFRSTENYNKLAYNTDFPWMADGENGEISMNYGVKNNKGQWEVLRLYTFKSYDNGIYRRDAVLETNKDIKFQLVDIPLANGILRVDKVTTPVKTNITLGHYSLPEYETPITGMIKPVKDQTVYTINNSKYELAMIPLAGWETSRAVRAKGIHPLSENCETLMSYDRVETQEIYITLQLWKKGGKSLSKKELTPVKKYIISDDKKLVEIYFSDNTKKVIYFE